MCQKCPFPAYTCCRRRVWKAFFGPNWAHFGLFWPFYGSEKPQANPPKPDQAASKSPKNGVWRHLGGILDRQKAISIYSRSTSKRMNILFLGRNRPPPGTPWKPLGRNRPSFWGRTPLLWDETAPRAFGPGTTPLFGTKPPPFWDEHPV